MLRQTDTLALSDWLRIAEAALTRAGYQSARHDAERLAAVGLGIEWGELWARLHECIDLPMGSELDALVARRRLGEPLAYITGSVVFYGIELECGPGVLVPRPETETLVDVALELIADRKAPVVVDVGTGTGAIAIAIARQHPDAIVWATEMYSDALRYAERNVMRLGSPVKVVQGDLLRALPGGLHRRLDLIVSNPPYVSFGAAVGLDVRAEPRKAVFAGPVGDEVLRRLAAEASEWAAPYGAIALEIGTPEQAGSVRSELRDFGPVHVRRDHTDRPRVVWARR
jgi:release factor glutamine methyltransferase